MSWVIHIDHIPFHKAWKSLCFTFPAKAEENKSREMLIYESCINTQMEFIIFFTLESLAMLLMEYDRFALHFL